MGIYAVPEILVRTITENDRYIIIGSDGVFEFLSNEEILNLVVKSNDMNICCKDIVREA